jgi:2-oxoglutarate dehydrogenase E2 component (dihydrolipoamide succinyltransferase)
MPIEVKVPHVGESVTEVYIGEWLKSEGDAVRADENLVELESDKATFEVPAPKAGVIEKIVKTKGETAAVGEVIALIDETAQAPAESRQPQDKPKEQPAAKSREEKQEKSQAPNGPSKEPPKAEAAPQPPATTKPAETKPSDAPKQPAAATPASARRESAEESDISIRPRIMPAARRALEEYGLRPDQVRATGPGGRLLKEDVLRHVGTMKTRGDGSRREALAPMGPPVAGRETEKVPMTPIRRRIAERLVESQRNAALLTTFNDVDMSAVMRLRNDHKEGFQKKHNVKLGFMSFFVKASVEALRAIPGLNARIDGESIVYHNYCDIGVAIGGGKGLLVPVLRNAERMSFAEIELAIADFAARAQKNKIELEELQGGTFTISNGGVYGSLLSTPIINPPQSGVLGMHRIEERPVAVSGQVVIRPMMYLALTYDHRIVDGREAVTFLVRIKETLEDPARMLLEI